MTSSLTPKRETTRPATTPVVIIGELNVDLIMSGCSRWPALGAEVNVAGCTMTLGSSSAICAVGLARLGRPVSFVGLVGQDPWGDYCVDVLRGAESTATAEKHGGAKRATCRDREHGRMVEHAPGGSGDLIHPREIGPGVVERCQHVRGQ